MDFKKVFEEVLIKFENEGIKWGLIGGFALGIMGILRTTMDLDFLLLIDDLPKADEILTKALYKCDYKTENLSQYSSDIKILGSIDIIHASKSISRGMLERVRYYEIFDTIKIPVVSAEDIIGLKVQAFNNDPDRKETDLRDINLILEHKKEITEQVDWQLLTSYFEIFNKIELFNELKSRYG